jgi:hypothetical protein
MRDGGKGDTPRPLGVSMEVFDKNFEAIFGKKAVKTYAGGKPHYTTEPIPVPTTGEEDDSIKGST